MFETHSITLMPDDIMVPIYKEAMMAGEPVGDKYFVCLAEDQIDLELTYVFYYKIVGEPLPKPKPEPDIRDPTFIEDEWFGAQTTKRHYRIKGERVQPHDAEIVKHLPKDEK